MKLELAVSNDGLPSSGLMFIIKLGCLENELDFQMCESENIYFSYLLVLIILLSSDLTCTSIEHFMERSD